MKLHVLFAKPKRNVPGVAGAYQNGLAGQRSNCRPIPLHARGWHCLALSAILGFVIPAVVRAQSATTGRISGRVGGDQDHPLAQVWVGARNIETGFLRTALTSADGTYAILLLPPGTYELRATLIGYQTARVAGLTVHAGVTTPANLHLRVAAIGVDTVQALARRGVIGMTTGGVARVITRAEIEQLPSLGRDFADFAALASVVSPLPEATSGGQIAIGGQRPSQTNLQIDGVDANNGFFADNRGSTRIPFSFPLESIHEFQVITNGYDVEYGRYSGGVVNVVTRGGTNDFEGTVFANLRHRSLTGEFFTPVVVQGDTLRRPRGYEVTQFGARVSGPVLESRLHYLVSLDGQRRREPFAPLSADAFLARGDTLSHAALTRFYSILASQYGVADVSRLYRPFETTNDAVTVFGRVDYTPGTTHRISARHNYAVFSNDREPTVESATGGLSTVEKLETTSHSFVTELQSVLGSRSFNVLRVQYSFEKRPRTASERRPELQVPLPSGDVARFGGHHVGFQNRFEERRAQIINHFVRQSGSHTVKVGGALLWTGVDILFGGALSAGVFRFNSLDDFQNYRPASYVRRMRSDGTAPAFRLSVLEWAAYAQDEWRVTDRLTATVGLRYDFQHFLDAAPPVVEIERAFRVQARDAPSDRDNISPRLHLTYDVSGDGRAIVRAGAGYFFGSIPYALGGSVVSREPPVLLLSCRGTTPSSPDAPPTTGDYAEWDRAGAENPASCAAASSLTGVPEYNLWDRRFEFPEILKVHVGWQHQATRRARVGVDAVYTRAQKLYAARNLNLGDPQFELVAEGGRRIFTPAERFTPASGAAQTSQRRFAEFSNVFLGTTDGLASATLLSGELHYQMWQRGQLRAAYTYSRAYDNSSFNCCALAQGYFAPRLGAYGPNELGGRRDESRAWGESDFNRPHTLVLSALTELSHGFRFSALWRINSGTPWTAEQTGDLNGDGVNFNDRPFIFAPEQLPLDPALSTDQQRAHRERYRGYLAQYPCIGDYMGRIIPRNTCRNPAFNRLDISLGYSVPVRGQRAELVGDVFNVLNLLNHRWGRYHGVFANRLALLEPRSFMGGSADPAGGTITYRVPTVFGEVRELGSNLMLQWQLQLSARYRF